jgi:cation transport ATPase
MDGSSSAEPGARDAERAALRSLWVVLVAAAVATWLAWGLVGRRVPDVALGIVLAVSVLVLPALGALALRRAARHLVAPLSRTARH